MGGDWLRYRPFPNERFGRDGTPPVGRGGFRRWAAVRGGWGIRRIAFSRSGFGVSAFAGPVDPVFAANRLLSRFAGAISPPGRFSAECNDDVEVPPGRASCGIQITTLRRDLWRGALIDGSIASR